MLFNFVPFSMGLRYSCLLIPNSFFILPSSLFLSPYLWVLLILWVMRALYITYGGGLHIVSYNWENTLCNHSNYFSVTCTLLTVLSLPVAAQLQARGCGQGYELHLRFFRTCWWRWVSDLFRFRVQMSYIFSLILQANCRLQTLDHSRKLLRRQLRLKHLRYELELSTQPYSLFFPVT
jgi:hypothetical protein